jgi:predicted nucleotidyltransferase
MSLQSLIQEKREDILTIAQKHGAYNIKIFGSVARGEDREDSDIDLLVEMESDRSLLDRKCVALKLLAKQSNDYQRNCETLIPMFLGEK